MNLKNANQILILDFSNPDFQLPETQISWQQEIIDFIRFYRQNDEIPVKTSGSTGTPKVILLPKKAMQKSAHLTVEFLQLEKGDTALLCLPVQYIAGKMMVVRALETGMKMICVEPKTEISIPQNVDFCAMTPMQAENSMEFLSQIQKLILGGAMVTDDLEKLLKSVPTRVFETYAMTETITHIAMRELNRDKAFQTLKDIQISQDERDCLVIKTPFFEEVIITNDVVEILSESQFKLKGRVDNVINSGGIKINPEEMENLLKPYISSPFVVHYVPDQKLGQKVVLVIESASEIPVDFPEDLIPKNQQPKAVFYLSELPRTETGKFRRNDIILPE